MDVEPIGADGVQPASAAPGSPREFLDWVAALHPDEPGPTLAEVVDRARTVRRGASGSPASATAGQADADWRPPFMTDTNARSDGEPQNAPGTELAGAPGEAGFRLFAPTEINAIYTGPGAPAPPDGAGHPPAGPAGPRPAPGSGPPPGYPPAYRPPPAYPPPYGPPPGYPPAYGPPPGHAAPHAPPPQAPPPQAPPPQAPPPQAPPPQAPPPQAPPPQAPPPPAYGYPTAHGRAPYPPTSPGPTPYGAPQPQPSYPPPAPAPQVASPYYNPNGAPGGGVLPAWDALPAQQRSDHFVGLPGWAQTLLWAQMNPTQRQELAAVLPPRPGS